MINEHWIMGILIPERSKHAVEVQNLLTSFGCSIRTRLGLHDISNENEGNTGLILLDLSGDPAQWGLLEKKLQRFEGIIVKKMTFSL